MIRNLTLVLLCIFLFGCGNNNDSSSGSYSSGFENQDDEFNESTDEENQTADGYHDCDVSNTTRGYGSYSLECEKNGDEVTINFNNGGHVTVDSDGYDFNTGDQWDVELQ